MIELDPCSPQERCTDCDKPAAGLRRNLDREPSCCECEAERIAMIEMILQAASEPDGSTQPNRDLDKAAQGSLF